MARWTASAKWAAGPALDGQRDMPLALRLSEGLGVTGKNALWCFSFHYYGITPSSVVLSDPNSCQSTDWNSDK